MRERAREKDTQGRQDRSKTVQEEITQDMLSLRFLYLHPYLLTVVNTICDNNADDDGSSYEEDGDFWACSTLASSLFPCALAKRAVELSVSPSPSSSVPSSSLMGVSSS